MTAIQRGSNLSVEERMIEIHVLHTIPELEAAVDLELAVWGLNPRHAVPSALMHVLALRGGLVLGAYDDTRMVGMLLSLPGQDGDGWLLWSHMTGVHPAYQGRGIGLALKRYQREWALEHGYRKIGWTVDPLQRGNAHFNFHLLGQDAALTACTYHVDFYGEMDDDINRGIPSDRIEAMWHIDQPCLHTPIPADAPPLLSIDADLRPMPTSTVPDWQAPAYTVALPRSLDAIRKTVPDGVLLWRLAVREALQAPLAHGYQIADFISTSSLNAYVLTRPGDAV